MPSKRSFLLWTFEVKTREDFTGAGEESTAETTYTGVTPAPWVSFPLLRREDKEKIMGFPCEVPPTKMFDSSNGQVLFWQDRKSVAFWSTLLEDFDIKCVIDLSPASGNLACAAMKVGATYTGITSNKEHCSWLTNIMDRQACELIVEQGSCLYEQDLAQLVKVHFSEVLDSLHDAEAAKDLEPEDS